MHDADLHPVDIPERASVNRRFHRVDTVVGADRASETSLAKRALEARLGEVAICRVPYVSGEQKSRGEIRDSQRLAEHLVAGAEMALEGGDQEIVEGVRQGGDHAGMCRRATLTRSPAARRPRAVPRPAPIGKTADAATERARQQRRVSSRSMTKRLQGSAGTRCSGPNARGRRLASWLALATTALGAVGCSKPASPELRIGIVALSEGPYTTILGVPSRQGADLAVEEINAAGGVTIAGVAHRVSLRIQPTAESPDAAASAASALINIDSVDVVIAPVWSSLASSAASVAQAADVLLIAPMSSNPVVTEGRDVAFRLAVSDAIHGGLLANFAFDSLGVRRVAALADEASVYGQEIVRLFRKRFEERAGRVVAVEGFASDGPRDFRPQLRRLLANRPDALLLQNTAGNDSVQLRQARELGFRGRFLGTDSWDLGDVVSLPLARGMIVVADWDDRSPDPEVRRFVAAFQRRFGEVPRSAAAGTYDAVKLAAVAVARSATRSGGSLSGILGSLGEYRGASAHFVFDGPGAPRRGAVVVEVLEGRDSVRLIARPNE